MAELAEASMCDYEMSMKTVHLEKEYEKTIAESARLLDAERDRVRRMEHLFLQLESDALQSQLEQVNEQLFGFTHADSETLVQLDEACQEIDRLESQVQSSAHEIKKLKSEISTLSDNSAANNNLLSEKVHLSREVSSLRAEVERLKTQNSSQQALVAEKHEMERQLNSLEVQIENEKNSHERTRAKSSQQAAEINKLSTKVEELQATLARELRANQQYERDSRQQNEGWNSQRESLEGKIESLRKQLRTTKDKLQEAQHDLQQRRSNVKSSDGDGSESQSRAVPLQRPGPSADYHSGVTIATPGAVRVQEKVKRQSALPGDKSAFSITPFLNRTGAPMDSPILSEVDEDEINEAMKGDSTSLGKARVANESVGSGLSPDDLPASVRNPPAKLSKPKPKAREGKPATSGLANELKKPASRPDTKVPLRDPDDLEDSIVEQGQSKPKKRKLGAQRDRNLFEDEDEEDMLEIRKPGRKLPLGAGRSSVLATTQQSGPLTGKPRNLGFGGFSPLKRDRKRV
ncbi:uncharacterized protein N7459_005150 [Penicillium hispanicum]|uniref:uncharacterized protein n=1 Tax=Penicillium hispanicum TaxID=1080232 RepID=UPI002540C577|nr:uncharacterized protein N7459_005150 [Penicillium hispanicum]KAJ5585350.1 hypothetical protein N7459_005150 [Penicillium hispanicum]